MRILLLPLALFVVVISTVFSEVRDQDFVHLDDSRNIYLNPYLNPITPSHISHFWRKPYTNNYRPVVYTAWSLIGLAARDKSARPVFGTRETTTLNAGVFHNVNLLLHIINTILVFFLLLLLVEKLRAARGGALLFGVHPAQVESVAWVTGFNELLYAFFSLLAIYSYSCHVIQSQKKRTQKFSISYALATLFFLFALLTKPTAVALPIISWCLAHWLLERPARHCTADLIVWVAISVPWISLTYYFESAQNKVVPIALWARPFIAGDALTFYLSKLVAPVQLGIDYGRSPVSVMQQTWVYAIWMIPSAILLAAWQIRKHSPWILGSVSVFVAALLPVLGFVPFTFQFWSTVADRYMYLALLGPAIASAVLLSRFKSKSLLPAYCSVLLLLAVKSSFQTLTWYNSYTLFENATRVNPRSVSAHDNLGRIFLIFGKTRKLQLNIPSRYSFNQILLKHT